MDLDFQDIAGTETANITRISANLRQSFINLDGDVVNLGIANTSEQAKATITYLNNELTAANNAVNLTLNNASLADTATPSPSDPAALQILATGAQGSELQHQIETFNINTVGRASTIATFDTGVSSFDDLVVGERPVTVNINAAVGLSVGTLRWESNRVETNSANGFQVATHLVGLNGEGFVDHDQINLITVTGAADVTLANVGNFETESDVDTFVDFTLNASTLTGNLTADITNAAVSSDASITGGSGRDRFYVANSMVLATVIGGAGLNDSLTVQSNLGGVTVAPGTGSGSVETLNLVQGSTSPAQAWTTTLNNGFTAVTFNNQAPVNAMTPTLTNMNGQLLSVRSQGFNGAGDPTTTAQGAVNIAFTQAAAVVGGTINLELGHASTDRAVTNAFSFANYSSAVSIIDNGVQGTTEAASLNLVVNTAGALGTGAANITVNNGDFETQTTLSSQIAAANAVIIGAQIATNSSDYTGVGTNALNSTTYAGGSYLGSQNVTFGGAQKAFNITTGVAADRVDLSFLTTDVSRTAAGFAASANMLNTVINMGGNTVGTDELVLSASLADPRAVLVADATYDQYFSNKSGIETLTINNSNNIGATYVALDGFAFDNNANLATINFADVSGQLALGFRFLNAVTINADATGAGGNQQAAKTTTLNSFSVANNTINVNASEAGNSVVYTSTGANLANTVTLNYNSIDNTGLVVNGTVGGNDDLIVTTGSLDLVNFVGDVGTTVANAGSVTVVTADSWTALNQTTAYNFAGVVNTLGTTQSLVTLNATAETNSTGLTIVGSSDGTAAFGVSNLILGSDGNIANGFGNDTITSGGFNDVIIALGGNNIVSWSNATAAQASSVNITALNGNDNLTANAASTAATITIDGGAGNDTIVNAGAGTSTLIGGLGLDTITSGSGNDSIDAGENADSVIILAAGTDTIRQRINDSNRAVTTDFGGDLVITTGDTMTFSNGVDIVRGFAAGAGGDVLLADVLVPSQSVFGQNASALTTGGWISGVFDVVSQRFTVTADGTGPDTAFIQIINVGVGLDNNLVAGTANPVNQSIVILLGVNAANLVNANFTGAFTTNLTATYAGTTWTFVGSALTPLTINATTATPNVTPATGVAYTGTYAQGAVTVIDFLQIVGFNGVNVNLDGAINAALASVIGTSGNDNFIFATEDFGDANSTVNGGAGVDTLTFTNIDNSFTLESSDGNGQDILQIENISLTNGTRNAANTTTQTLTLAADVSVANNGSAVAITNANATAAATVVLGTGAAHSFTTASTGIQTITVGQNGQNVTTGSGADNIIVATTGLALTGTLNAGTGANTLTVTLANAQTVNFTGATLTGTQSLIVTSNSPVITIDEANLAAFTTAITGAAGGGDVEVLTLTSTGNGVFNFSNTAMTLIDTVTITNGGSNVTFQAADVAALATLNGSAAGITTVNFTNTTSLAAKTVGNIDVITIAGVDQTLTVDGDEAGAGGSFLTTTGSGTSNLVYEVGAGAASLSLTNTTVSGFDSIDITNGVTTNTLTIDSESIVGNTTLVANAAANLALGSAGNFSNISLTAGDFDSLLTTSATAATVSNGMFAGAVVLVDSLAAGDDTALTIAMSSATLDLGAIAFGTTNGVDTTITGTAGNDTITFANAKAAGSTMVVTGNGGTDTFRFEGASGNATGGDLLVIANAVAITDFNSANDIITGQAAGLFGVNATVGAVATGAWNLDTTGPGFALITGATVADFSNLAAVSAAVGIVTATATDVAYFAVTNINESQVGIYRVAFAATGAIDAADDLTLVSVIDNTGDFNALNLGLY